VFVCLLEKLFEKWNEPVGGGFLGQPTKKSMNDEICSLKYVFSLLPPPHHFRTLEEELFLITKSCFLFLVYGVSVFCFVL